MAVTINKLSDTEIKNAKPKEKTYRLADGGGLYVEIKPEGGKYWRMKYRYAGMEKRLAIGVYPDTTLKAAREAASEAKKQLAQGIDPSIEKRHRKLEQQNRAANSFEAVAMEWYGKHPTWKPTHSDKILARLKNYLFPYLGRRPIQEITGPELLACLNRIEKLQKIETAHRVKQIAGQVFRYGIATGKCGYDVSAGLKGALAEVDSQPTWQPLPTPPKLAGCWWP
jgi:hypothetical protein